MSTEEVGRSFLSRIGGRHTGSVASAKSGLKIDVKQVKDLNTELGKTAKLVESISKSLATFKLPGGKATTGGYMNIPVNPPTSLGPGQTAAGSDSGTSGVAMATGGAGTYRNAQMSAFKMYGAMEAGGSMMRGLDSRIDRGMNYSVTADRYNVVMQQQYGLSQNQVMNQMRKPLANYRLGADGINQLQGFQINTGYKATPQLANSLAGIRVLSGYSKTAADVIGDQQSMMDPTVANRMLYMTGANAYTFGGGLNDPMKMRQQLTKSMGLTNADILRGAKGPGSVTRARMSDAGISDEMQTEILTYAQSNLTFQKKGGKGMYDPSKKADRQRMGVEGNLATQTEETDRLRQSREESFSRRQLDNMASLEKNTQQMVKLLGGIEDKLSGLIGARASTRGWQRMLGSGLQIAGGIAALTGVGSAAAIPLMMGGTMLQGAAGDPVSADGGTSGTGANKKSAGDSNVAVPYGYGGKRVPLNELKGKEQFRSLNPKLQERLLAMFRDNPNIGIGGGGRSETQQRQMFLSRYRKTSAKTDIFWEGSYWEHVSGAAAAPPGRSMHEIGLAADLVGDMGWIKKNASKYGLRSFFDVNSEPWHVQPAELPGSRREYEKRGAPWGGGSKGGSDPGTGNAVNDKLNPDTSEKNMGALGGSGFLKNLDGLSIAQIMASVDADSGALLGGGSSFTKATEKKAGSSTIGDTPMAGVTSPNTGGALAGVDVAKAAYAAGFRGQDLVKMIAIAKRESGWKPRAYNGNEKTGDHSYGLWQLNTLNSKKGGQMGDLVNSILGKPAGNTDFNDLFDPQTNARVAFEFYKRNGNTTRPWGGYKGVSDTHNADQYMTAAQQAVSAAHLGDPTGERRGTMGGGNGSMSVSNTPTFNITVAPQITFVGMPQAGDLKKVANEVTGLIEQNVRALEMRGA